jgi:hypothetical protein
MATDYATTECPYCGVRFDPLPKLKKACPACRRFVWVRSGPDGLRHLLRDVDLEAHEASWIAHLETRDAAELNAEARRVTESSLVDYARMGVLVSLSAADDACPACRTLDGRTFDPRSAPAAPIRGCVNLICRCFYTPVVG